MVATCPPQRFRIFATNSHVLIHNFSDSHPPPPYLWFALFVDGARATRGIQWWIHSLSSSENPANTFAHAELTLPPRGSKSSSKTSWKTTSVERHEEKYHRCVTPRQQSATLPPASEGSAPFNSFSTILRLKKSGSIAPQRCSVHAAGGAN